MEAGQAGTATGGAGLLGRAAAAFPVAVLLLTMGGLLTVYFTKSAGPPIRSDGVGYYAYLPAALIQRDLTFASMGPVLQRNGYPIEDPNHLPIWTGLDLYEPTGRPLNKYPMGVAVLASPMFFLAHGLTWLFEQPMDGFSLLYHFGIAFSGLFYGVTGLLLLRKFLEQRYGQGPALATAAVLLLGTNLFHYLTYDSTTSHAYTFCLVVLLLLQTERWWAAPTLGGAVLLGAIVGLIGLVRNPNLMLGLVIPLYGVAGAASARARVRALAASPVWPAAMGAVCAAILLPQMMYWKFATGHWLVGSYQYQHFDFLHPALLQVLFSIRKGVFFWAPLLALGVAGCFTPRFRKDPFLLSVIAIFGLELYLVASWSMWWFGGGFGHRAFVDIYPLMALPMAALFASVRKPWVRGVLGGVCAALILLNLIHMLQYWKRIMPYDQMDWTGYRMLFLRIMRN